MLLIYIFQDVDFLVFEMKSITTIKAIQTTNRLASFTIYLVCLYCFIQYIKYMNRTWIHCMDRVKTFQNNRLF